MKINDKNNLIVLYNCFAKLKRIVNIEPALSDMRTRSIA